MRLKAGPPTLRAWSSIALKSSPWLPVVAITGSSGKTTTRDLLAQLVSPDRKTVAAEKSFNNAIGVPLTIFRADRTTEVLLPEPSFAALRSLFTGEEFARTRPFVDRQDPFEIVRAARGEGNTATQAFHESLATKRTGMAHILRDAVAFANTEGGTIYIGASPSDRRPVAGGLHNRSGRAPSASRLRSGMDSASGRSAT